MPEAAPILKIPEEILSDILVLVCDCKEDPKKYFATIVDVQLVCTQFRSTSLNSPQMWSHVDSTKGVEGVRRQLSRSGAVPLSLHLSLADEEVKQGNVGEMLALLKESSKRFRKADVFIFIDKETTGELDQNELDLLIGWDLSELVMLVFDVYIEADNFKVEDLAWNTPKLKYLGCGSLPHSVNFPFVAPVEDILQFPLAPYDGEQAMRLLSSASETLRYVVIDYSCCLGVYTQQEEVPGQSTQARPRISFPRLDYVRILLHYEDTDGLIFKLFERFDFSNVERVEVTTYRGYHENLSPEENVIFTRFLSQSPSCRDKTFTTRVVAPMDEVTYDICSSVVDETIVYSGQLDYDLYIRDAYVKAS
jgi:hypothetical protein